MILILRTFHEHERTRLYVQWMCALFTAKLHIVQDSPSRCTNCASSMNVANEVAGRWPRSSSSASFMHGPTFSSLNDTVRRNRLGVVHEATRLQNSLRCAPGIRRGYALKCQHCAV